MKPVELHVAYVWDCDDCGRENFERGIRFEPTTDEERAELESQLNPGEGGHWMTRPDEVKCRRCGAEYSAVDTGAE